MSEKQTLEEAWDRVYEFTECATWHRDSCIGYDTAQADALDAARALALAVLEEASAWVDDLSEDEEYGLGAVRKLRRRIEALGREA